MLYAGLLQHSYLCLFTVITPSLNGGHALSLAFLLVSPLEVVLVESLNEEVEFLFIFFSEVLSEGVGVPTLKDVVERFKLVVLVRFMVALRGSAGGGIRPRGLLNRFFKLMGWYCGWIWLCCYRSGCV